VQFMFSEVLYTQLLDSVCVYGVKLRSYIPHIHNIAFKCGVMVIRYEWMLKTITVYTEEKFIYLFTQRTCV
jgi:hypothetical protein